MIDISNIKITVVIIKSIIMIKMMIRRGSSHEKSPPKTKLSRLMERIILKPTESRLVSIILTLILIFTLIMIIMMTLGDSREFDLSWYQHQQEDSQAGCCQVLSSSSNHHFHCKELISI